LIYVVFAVWMGLAAGVVGKFKGSSFFIWFMVGAILPVLGVLAAVLYRSDRDELRRQCPGCGRIVMLHDAICTRCGYELEFPDIAIESRSSAEARR
jgi:membrane protein implicated in regulation of membrane protease activity